MRILISGGGVAGPALAFWLTRYGHQATLVERAPAIRAGGSAIDFRGTSLDVLERMGLLEEMRAHQTRMSSMTIVDEAGAVVAELPDEAISGELEVLKEDVTRVLFEATREAPEYVCDDSITAIADDGTVTFESGRVSTYDLVIGADGLHSRVRRLAFGPEERYVRNLGIYGALFTIDNVLGLDYAGVMHNTPGHMAIALSARDNRELRVGLSFTAQDLAYDRHDRAQQEDLVAAAFEGAGWEVPRLLAEMRKATDFFFDSSSQVVMDSWSNGRVALLGDAAYCAAPTSGRGTSQALVGAYILAGEIATNPGDAFAAYEAQLRPYVTLNQARGRAGARWFFQEPDDETVDNLAAEQDDTVPIKLYG
ncbi:MAG: FAD-dependent oxidoreductase [Nonomuraea sp.]|nr:FAD-dependent oxidoreductase [Nonomuraea sp.]